MKKAMLVINGEDLIEVPYDPMAPYDEDYTVYARVYQYDDDLSVADACYSLDGRFGPVYGEQFINRATTVQECEVRTPDQGWFHTYVTFITDWYTIPRED